MDEKKKKIDGKKKQIIDDEDLDKVTGGKVVAEIRDGISV